VRGGTFLTPDGSRTGPPGAWDGIILDGLRVP